MNRVNHMQRVSVMLDMSRRLDDAVKQVDALLAAAKVANFDINSTHALEAARAEMQRLTREAADLHEEMARTRH